jgi:hopene-associated glycosyltransferase HpnB
MMVEALAPFALAVWGYLLIGRGGFWLGRERDDAPPPPAFPAAWPEIVAVIPARDEARTIGESVGSLLRQDYPGRLSLLVVDDQSSDGTAEAARAAAEAAGAATRLAVVAGGDPPPGWTGKLWAMRQGLTALEKVAAAPEFVLFSDADIAYEPRALARLVAIAEAKGASLASLMVKLRCESAAERWLVPAFVFFFQMLYPFAWVADRRRRVAAAAGGCMLTRRTALFAAGGLEAVRGALIDDCALGALMKRQGPIWLGLTENAVSLRPYPTFVSFGAMVARSAFAELGYSSLRLAGAMVGMAATYLAPPLLALFADGWARWAGALAWAAMAASFAPTLRLYRRPLAGGFALPAIALAYLGFTSASAVLYWRGCGGYWKGRIQAPKNVRA